MFVICYRISLPVTTSILRFYGYLLQDHIPYVRKIRLSMITAQGSTLVHREIAKQGPVGPLQAEARQENDCPADQLPSGCARHPRGDDDYSCPETRTDAFGGQHPEACDTLQGGDSSSCRGSPIGKLSSRRCQAPGLLRRELCWRYRRNYAYDGLAHRRFVTPRSHWGAKS